MRVWCIDPQSGGIKIPLHLQKTITDRVVAHSLKSSWYPRFQLKIRIQNKFCYLDALEEGREAFPIGRLRYFSEESWSLAFYTYSNERYQPCVFPNGKWFGTIEEAIDVCAVYLN